jgi:hypothetical protein
MRFMFQLAATRLNVEARTLMIALSRGMPDVTLPTLYGVGDQLMLRTVARELCHRNPRVCSETRALALAEAEMCWQIMIARLSCKLLKR